MLWSINYTTTVSFTVSFSFYFNVVARRLKFLLHTGFGAQELSRQSISGFILFHFTGMLKRNEVVKAKPVDMANMEPQRCWQHPQNVKCWFMQCVPKLFFFQRLLTSAHRKPFSVTLRHNVCMLSSKIHNPKHAAPGSLPFCCHDLFSLKYLSRWEGKTCALL